VLKKAGKILKVGRDNEKYLVTVNIPGWGASLGRYIFMDQRYTDEDWKHEYGHSRQSLHWGPLYLPAIGIPSAVFNNLWDRIFHKYWPDADRHIWYYNRYPEKQADKLGGVSRI
jgi:hypothetical protein